MARGNGNRPGSLNHTAEARAMIPSGDKNTPPTHLAIRAESSALPHPDEMRVYEELHPGTMATMLSLLERSMALEERQQTQNEKQQAHQHVVDFQVIEDQKLNNAKSWRFRSFGQGLGALIVLSGLAAVVGVAALNAPGAAIGVSLILAGGAAAAIRRATDATQQQNQAKQEPKPPPQ